MSVMGFVEVLKNYNRLSKILNNTVSEIKISRPDKILLVDYPGFNLRLVKKIKNLDIPITYFILPQTWAWKENRILFMKKPFQILYLFSHLKLIGITQKD